MLFAIVDIETTGGNPTQGGITEIAALVHDGEKIVDQFHTLINPERFIPGFITGLTGIDQQMVSDAPVFSDIAHRLFEFLNDKVFIAHNVNFDYSFIKESLKKEGYTLDVPKLCTVRLSRKVFPGYKSYGLGRICEQLSIKIENRHRAYGDAAATAKLFEKIFSKSPDLVIGSLKKNNGEGFLPPNISKEQYLKLPGATGVYYFHDAKGQVIYVGKALDIKSRFKGHFTGNTQDSEKTRLRSEIHDISWEVTGSEFLAYLLELLEIRRLWPKYNKAQKFKSSSWGLYQYEDSRGFIRFQVGKSNNGLFPMIQFDNHSEGWKFLMDKVKEYELCPKLSGIQKVPHECYDVKIGICKGACCGQEEAISYNKRAKEFITLLRNQTGNIIIKEKGRSTAEEAALYFENGIFAAYGFFSKEQDLRSDAEIMESLKKVNQYPDSKYILRTFLSKIPLGQIKMVKSEGSLF
ncbi:exonuclease domain-containing protein [Aquiflexum sp.]|uniref:exonuclease domain-containing protein n=1 Tax=Aquiflexum sp. TaxID=1872584 RepID=UPI0035944501